MGAVVLATLTTLALALYARRISPDLLPQPSAELTNLDFNPYVIGLAVQATVVPVALLYLLSNTRAFRRVVSGEAVPRDTLRLFGGLVVTQLLTLSYQVGFSRLTGEPIPPPVLLVIAGGLLGGWRVGLGLGLITMLFCGSQDFLIGSDLLELYRLEGLRAFTMIPWDRVFLWNYITNLWASVAVWAGVAAGLGGELLGERWFAPGMALCLGMAIVAVGDALTSIAGAAPGAFFLIPDALVSGIAIAAIGLMVRNVQVGAARRKAEVAALARTQAELRALRAQINPHFLFNALNTIRYFVRTDPETARRLLLNLSEVFQRAFRSGEFVPLQDEISYVEAYLALEKARLNARLRVEWDIRTEEHLDQPVPTLILQPIVENAVVHGIAQKPEGGTVHITIDRIGSDLVLQVEDDGPGITPERLAEVLNSNYELQTQYTAATRSKPVCDQRAAGRRPAANTLLRSAEAADRKAIGLRNVDRRLRALYGEEYRLSVESEVGRGTRVLIRVPIAREVRP